MEIYIDRYRDIFPSSFPQKTESNAELFAIQSYFLFKIFWGVSSSLGLKFVPVFNFSVKNTWKWKDTFPHKLS